MTARRSEPAGEHDSHAAAQWPGQWVADRLDIRLHTDHSPLGVPLPELVGLAVRRNPRRAHLLVSTLLGKHVPTEPRLVHAGGLLLGLLVADVLAGQDAWAQELADRRAGAMLRDALRSTPGAAARLRDLTLTVAARAAAKTPTGTVVLGYAETATALGHCVAEALAVPYLHSTRRRVPGVAAYGGFEEEHSHATSHLLLPGDRALLTGAGPLVLVDDELSTGQTVLNTIAALHASAPRARYVVAALVDLRSDEDRARMTARADVLGVRIDVVALSSGRVELPPDVGPRGRDLVSTQDDDPTSERTSDRTPGPPAAGVVHRVAAWPGGTRESGRHGFHPTEQAALDAAVRSVADAIVPALVGDHVLVLGFEELMYAPMRIAEALADRVDEAVFTGSPRRDVRCSATTRSPVLSVDDVGYAIRTRLVFPAHDGPTDDDSVDGAGVRYAYNVAPGGGGRRPFTDTVLVVDDVADTAELDGPDGLLTQLREHTDAVHLVVVPAARPARLPEPLYGPAFGSYAREEVAWLLTDLSDVDLEAPTAERERAIQDGRAHYCESLPVEFRPSTDYQRLYLDALAESATRVAHAVGVVTELVLAARGCGAVLVSLARAGTPIGILMRRWAQQVHGIDLPHYAVSIVRGRGIDTLALAYLAARHDPARVMFVDGWTGKGAITRELAAAVERANTDLGLVGTSGFRTDLAVLADTGRCVEIYGTRADFLVPSACLNSTVSGLVSRTVLNDALIGPGQFHGAKFYAQLASEDVSHGFLDAVSGRFADVGADVAADWPVLAASDRAPTWSGWAAVEQICRQYGIDDVNLVKPGVGETTRVLLRRVPWKVLARPDAAADLRHVRLLAHQRGVPVVEVPDLAYSCIGLIQPQRTRGDAPRVGTAGAEAGA